MRAGSVGTCLLYMTITKLLESTHSVATISITSMSIYFAIFAFLLRYNYRLQPCLGSGLFPNNLRAVSFATSCWTSLAVIVTTHGPNTVPIIFVALYPFGVGFLWWLNSGRARQYHIQNQSLTDALTDPNLRVRTVAIVSITLEDHSRWKADEIMRVLQHLQVSLAMPGVAEDGLLVAYACQAVWHLCCQHYTLSEAMVEKPGAATTELAPFNLWVVHRHQPSALLMKSRHSNAGAGTRLQELVDRKAETNTRSGITTVAPVVVGNDSFNALRNTQLLKQCLEIVLQRATSMLALPFPKACNIVAKLLQEMYLAQNVQLTLGTWLSVVCTLCSNYNQEVAAQAATSLCATMMQFDMAVVLPLLCDSTKLTAISQLLVAPNALLPLELLRDRVVAFVLARAAAQITRTAPARDPILMYTPTFVANLTTAWRRWQGEYSMTLALESVLALMQKAQVTWRSMAKRKSNKQQENESSGMSGHSDAAPPEATPRGLAVQPVVTGAVVRPASSRRANSSKALHSIPPKVRAPPTNALPSPSRHPNHQRPDRPNLPAHKVHPRRTKVLLIQNDPSRQQPGRRRSLDAKPSRKMSKTHANAGPSSQLTKLKSQHSLMRGLSLIFDARHGRSRSFDHRRQSRHNSVHTVVKNLRTKSLSGDSFIRNLNPLAKGGATHDLVPPSIWRDIKLRRAVRLHLMTQVSTILTEGLSSKLLPQLFTPTTAQALHALVSILHRYPVMNDHLAYVLQPQELRYITFVKSWQEARSNPAPALIKPRLWTTVSSHVALLVDRSPWPGHVPSKNNAMGKAVPPKAVAKPRAPSVATLQFSGLNFVTERRRRHRSPARHSTGRRPGT
ncbi:hypothetical protein DYB32_000627 [Aphanomyces invadans]|uniref:Uncharacterized protein n=1 Tax=Aphanomyces invadans TaxID=157072 RepID=A0A418B9E3_9STRA|nr:hypothetical protein DYB32_000627 [Aphanomyces invadans]